MYHFNIYEKRKKKNGPSPDRRNLHQCMPIMVIKYETSYSQVLLVYLHLKKMKYHIIVPKFIQITEFQGEGTTYIQWRSEKKEQCSEREGRVNFISLKQTFFMAVFQIICIYFIENQMKITKPVDTKQKGWSENSKMLFLFWSIRKF